MSHRICAWTLRLFPIGGTLGALVLSGCGGGGGSAGVPIAPTSSAASTATPAPTGRATPLASPTASATPAPTGGLSAAAKAFLALDLSALANYATQTLPVYYDAQVRAMDNAPPSNPVTDRGATLGRVLFNDKRLSINGSIACASCHQQSLGFTDAAQFSAGFAGVLTTRHAPRLGNVRYYQPGTMFWDKRAASIEVQVDSPLTSSTEMGFDTAHGGFASLAAKMGTLPYYPELFAFAFGDSTITQTRIELALAQFERSMVTFGSRWDVGYATVYDPQAPQQNLDVDLPNFTAQENRGRHLFMAAPGQGGIGCAACHSPPTFALNANSRSNGLDAGETTIFKAPSLKNDSRGPYMHDGRFATLAQVVDHYDHGVLIGPALDPRLTRGGAPQQLDLSASDKAAVVAFLATLDDPGFFTDPRFSNPFKQ